MHSKKEDFKLFFQPFDIEPENVNEDFLMELNELQSNEFYKSKLGAAGTSVIEFYMKYLNKSKSFPDLIDHTKKFICIFGNTFCEQLFSKMKYIESKLQSKLPDRHLDLLLRFVCSNIQANIEKIYDQKQHRKSH